MGVQRAELNEDHLLKAFLMHNGAYETILYSEYIHKHHKSAFSAMPLSHENLGGNLWLTKN